MLGWRGGLDLPCQGGLPHLGWYLWLNVAMKHAPDIPVRCTRCRGLMVPVRLEETAGATSGSFLTGWRCLQCGEVLDPVIEANRKSKTQPSQSRKPRLPIGRS
jgi:hypothetical protein